MPQGDVVFVAMLDVSGIVLVGGFCVVVSLASLGFICAQRAPET